MYQNYPCGFNGAFEVHFFFQGFILYTLIPCRDMQVRFSKVKTLLNNAFNIDGIGSGMPKSKAVSQSEK